MSYGSAVTASDVPDYLNHVYHGNAPEDLIAEFQRRYNLVGRSPLIDITTRQARLLQQLLDSRSGEDAFRVDIGMLHSEPTIAKAVARFRESGVDAIQGVILAPHYSSIIMGGYQRAVEQAATAAGFSGDIAMRGAWHTGPQLIAWFANAVSRELEGLPSGIPLIFTAHSLPKSVIDQDIAYLDQLHETIALICEQLELAKNRWQFAYQSAGHTPEEWLKPDLTDLFPGIRDAGHQDILVVPLQFVADHLEVLYDLDIAAEEQARQAGLSYHRIEMPNEDPLFISALADVVSSRRALI
jgi:ferrochelatase